MADKENIYSKLAVARVTLQSKDLKKTGKNSFSKYEYFQLADFLPAVNKVCADMGLLAITSFSSCGLATLTLVNSDEPSEQIVFTSPKSEANVKGAQPIQNLGAMETYQRRYLYMLAFEITDADVVDEDYAHNKPTQSGRSAEVAKQFAKDWGSAEVAKQFAKAWGMAEKQGYTGDSFKALVKNLTGKENSKELTAVEVAGIINELVVQQAM